ncbi:hypothetical protein COW36_24800 [bacterium (Candidatus Blackallbacteria) CG17_big_fil_post_rev_8_21_14_2_50_48_46]|uniref:Response regulatory domain-containing protein n=1 Tax=bacterium (Candidatus Blackallbacteria) CG17_big_fil_post_rev_8_21_14_2_50_48_46 TaxID=2014261 RepID=A0A2M7FXA0_9BACT|nr:MAG: hypothetical protein COW64_19740 [bacterium (Candidatus Blackallbacteria) CG18_big_fil_WC_8_21_14_2_50_49_26]PIW13888.1 MAG: hypothetical protein COW36_24800 [bacterium (Candidatus Blackallbacteria) CG17_big_fil_post_rev_8_21_14_2_50_48_46]PIW45114.1 MAG: hypothetical protein COW20_22430 [bacterium (Candidatus Blackallbacteria) CG13_big_fil_rev_8_21_14_2_50_49_14]
MSISLLVVSPSYSIREMLARYLPYEEYTVYTAESAEKALFFFEKMPIDAVVIELKLQSSSGLDLLDWMGQHHPNIHPVMICDDEDEDLIELIRTRKASYLLKKKLNLLQFRTKLQSMCKFKRGLTYQFNQVSIFELVKLVSFSGRDYHLYLTSPQTHQEGLIYFGQGKVQHAMYGELTGEKAFYEIMKMKRGLFSELQVMETDDEVITSSLDQLMANSALILDEKSGPAQAQLPPTSCLIVSEDKYLPVFLGELFRFHQESVLVTNWVTTFESVQEQLMKNPELLILDSDMESLKAKKVLDFIDGNYLDTRVILIGAHLQASLSQTLKHPNVVRFFLREQYQELAELIEQTYLAQHFSGELLDLALFGVLQIFSYFRHPRLLEVTDYFSGQAGQIFISDGEVLHATFGDYIGRDALKKILQVNYGVFRQEAYWEPVTKSLNIPFNRLMMHLSRFVDENNPYQMARDLLLQNGEVITIRSDKIQAPSSK